MTKDAWTNDTQPPPTHPFPISTLPKNKRGSKSGPFANETDPGSIELTLADLVASRRNRRRADRAM